MKYRTFTLIIACLLFYCGKPVFSISYNILPWPTQLRHTSMCADVYVLDAYFKYHFEAITRDTIGTLKVTFWNESYCRFIYDTLFLDSVGNCANFSHYMSNPILNCDSIIKNRIIYKGRISQLYYGYPNYKANPIIELYDSLFRMKVVASLDTFCPLIQ
jgi:hypothetical protein